jgi:hypothetical protein
MIQDHITRRRALAITSIALPASGCAGVANLVVRVVPKSVLRRAGRVGDAVAASVVALGISDWLGWTDKEREEVETAAEKEGVDPKLAKEVAAATSKDLLMSCLRTGTAIWCQFEKTPISLNRFDVEILNDTDAPLSGQFRFSVVDVESDTTEFSFWRDPFTLRPHSRSRLEYSCRGPFPRPGVKRIVVDRHPDGLVWTPVNTIVIPATAQLIS